MNIKSDMEAGTQGNWVVDATGDTYYIECEPGFNHAEAYNEADARRIARVPQLERIALAADALADAFEYVSGIAWSEGMLRQQDEDALAAYREATKP